MLSGIFGTETAGQIMLYIVNYGEGTSSGIARTMEMSKNRVYQAMLKLEDEGVLVARAMGNQRIFTLNPRLTVKKELESLLRKILADMPQEEFDRRFAERRRPRKTGKAL